MKWKSINITPPDEMLEVIDSEGNMAKANPTYCPFKVVENQSWRKWDSKIIFCEPYWDGGWMIKCNGMEIPEIKTIIKWRKLK